MVQGIVIRNTGSDYAVKIADGREFACKVKGNFRIKGIRTTNPVAVGDIVDITPTTGEAAYITKIEPRRNYIIRRASNLSKESHILAANIDLAILVATLREPQTTTTFIDRFLATAEAYAIPAVLVLNKEDMWDDDDCELADAIVHLYTTIGYRVICTSARSGKGIEGLRALTAGKISLLAGNSGVGKSSLANALIPGLNARIGAVSDIHHTGTHTTTFSEMYALPGGGGLIDIPGVKGFGTIELDTINAGHYFPEIFAVSSECRYSNCTHTHEPGCAVLQAVEDHRIAESRYNSYLSVLGDSDPDKYRKPF